MTIGNCLFFAMRRVLASNQAGYKLHAGRFSIQYEYYDGPNAPVQELVGEWIRTRWQDNLIVQLGDPMLPKFDISTNEFMPLYRAYGLMPYLCNLPPTLPLMARHLLVYLNLDLRAAKLPHLVSVTLQYANEHYTLNAYEVNLNEVPVLTPLHPNWPNFCKAYKEFLSNADHPQT